MSGSDTVRGMRTTDFIALAVLFGMAAGLTEAAVWAVRRYALHELTSLSFHVIWMAPFVYAILLGVLAIGVAAAARLLRRPLHSGAAVFVVALPALAAVLLLLPRVHIAAVLLLAAGLAHQLQRRVHAAPARWSSAARRGVLVLAALIVGAAGGLAGGQAVIDARARGRMADSREGAPNVLFIILDTMRAASMSLYGYARPTTPQLEQLGRTGTVFDLAVSTAPWTLPSHASMFTGRYPHELDADWREPLGTEFPTLAGTLAQRGYLSAGFVANTGYASRETGLARGFHHYADHRITLGEVLRQPALTRWIADSFRVRRIVGTDEHLNRQGAPVVSRRFLRWLDDRPADRPFFAFLNYYDAHGPYLPPSSHETRFGPARVRGAISPLHRWNWDPSVGHRPLSQAEVREEVDAYDAAIAFLDEELGRLFRELEQRGLLDRTLVVITADHGEEFGEHGVYDHGNSLYLASVHVPLLIRLPGVVPAGMRVAVPVSLRDLPATVLALVGPEGAPGLPGTPLTLQWSPDAAPGAGSAILSEVRHASGHPEWFPVSRGDMRALLGGGVRYIRNGDGVEELYDATADVWERFDLARDPAWSAALDRSRALLGEWTRDGHEGVARP